MLFQSRSICYRNTSIGTGSLWEWDSEPIKRFRRLFRFWDARELVEDNERGGAPKSTRTEVNISAVADLVKKDRRIAIRMIAESLNIPKTVVLRILKKDLGKRKLCARYVPHCMPPEQRKDRVTSCQDINAMADWYKNFFQQYYYGSETWCFAHDPETKRQSSEWVGETSRLPKKLKSQMIIFSTLKAQCTKNSHLKEKQKMQNFVKEQCFAS